MCKVKKEILPMLDGRVVSKLEDGCRHRLARLTQTEDGVVTVHRLPACSLGDYFLILSTLAEKGYKYQ